MSVKSLLQIDVDDSKFKSFAAQFQRYQDALGKMPKQWADMAKQINRADDEFADLKLAAISTAATLEKMAANQDKFMKAAQGSAVRMESLSRQTAGVAKHIGDATLNLLKWGAITGALGTAAGGLLGLGSLWGIDRLGAAAGGARRSAMGLGITSGEQQAFSINYGRAVDPGSTLGAIADAKSDVSKWMVFGALGIKDYQNRDAADLAPDVIRGAKNLFDRNPTQQAANAFHLTDIFSMDDLRRLHGMSPAELDQMQRGYQHDRSKLAVGDQTQRAWQDFTAQLQRAGTEIENTLIKGLVGLEKPLEHLSAGFSDLIEALANSPKVKVWIDDLGDGLEALARKLGWITGDGKSPGTAPPGSAPDTTPQPGWAQSLWDHGKRAFRRAVNPDLTAPLTWANMGGNSSFQEEGGANWFWGTNAKQKTQIAHDYFRRMGWTEAQTAGLLGYVAEESSWRTGAVNPKSGAAGLAQWLGARKAQFKLAYGYNPDQAPLFDQLNFMQWELTHTEKAAADKLRATYDPRDAAAAVMRYYGRPSDAEYQARHSVAENAGYRYYGKLAPESKAPTKVDINIHNNTGGSAVVSSSQTGGQ